MAKKDKEILENIRIETVAAEGNALAHVNGKALFVPMAIPGDIVRVQITHKKKSYMQGYMLELVTPSPMRLKPFCTHFGNCGGCHWQSIPYDKQLEFKQQQVIDQLTRIGKLDLPTIIPILGSEKTVRYRNKLEFTFSNSRWVPIEELRLEEGAPLPSPSPLSLRFPTLGFHVRGRFDKVLDIDTCYLQEEPSNAIRLAIRDYAITKGLSFFDLRQQTGFLRTLMIRTTLTGQVMVVVVFAHDNLQAGEDHAARKALLDHLQRTFPQITSLHYVINTKRNDSLGDQEVIHYAGKPYIVEQMEDLQFRIGPKSFYQTNSLQALQMYRKIREFADLQGNETVYDLYTGTGTIALFLAHHCHKVTGIEYVPEAIDDALKNASANHIENVRFFAGDIKDVLTADFIVAEGHPRVVVLDPPRAGVHENVLKVLLETVPEKIIYVSCNPATQARDLGLLQPMYRITHVQPVDMFPHTHHVENIVVAEKI
ncbi:MAG: 23S rRNA (uracil(1939)-C(5))-methyltransferase RlmD [Bacteroidales bacterium]|jgi:23S rRNA (uracil1939-C5)-methyltransferase|nr:23S rRNA (uracil(1939)-C(5))-methyltransferase RlmD [Bacteroidales bacterium]MDD2264508.1 23S rRNA (uracil(1939)-C(5))-methyltransferase RlmD [Bacteroidales bacterium]MDD2831743.1 23S rRNA (uracil(1939)-C(5))-methyltransferase RlmD [Bacteroidales bacterium]MDD3208970.1 23S rRNA (uracil(1939)-C(5))-methyltransferase RlmD [Bacteroidales bacterium]MDD3697658.1 23S rRNA (uracil(1939)-C(5))-methyltransferase RlmD [Bacteroidales bacterium]